MAQTKLNSNHRLARFYLSNQFNLYRTQWDICATHRSIPEKCSLSYFLYSVNITSNRTVMRIKETIQYV